MDAEWRLEGVAACGGFMEGVFIIYQFEPLVVCGFSFLPSEVLVQPMFLKDFC